jgi:hypothetical protein
MAGYSIVACLKALRPLFQERCDLVGVHSEKVHKLFQVFAFVPKEW